MNRFQTESGTAHQETECTGGHMAKEFIEKRIGYDNLTDSDVVNHPAHS